MRLKTSVFFFKIKGNITDHKNLFLKLALDFLKKKRQAKNVVELFIKNFILVTILLKNIKKLCANFSFDGMIYAYCNFKAQFKAIKSNKSFMKNVILVIR